MAFRRVLVAVATSISLALAGSAYAANSGQMTAPGQHTDAPSVPGVALLTYGAFTGGTCSQGAFSVGATGTLLTTEPTTVKGLTFLDGAPYDTFTFALPPGPLVFGTGFGRSFSPPPPASATYTFVFSSNLLTESGQFLGRSVTTFQCTDGVLTGSNAWVDGAAVPIPTLSEWTMILLALILAGGGALALRRRPVPRT